MSLTTALIDELDRILMPVSVQYETRDGSAKQGVHYQKTEGVLVRCPSSSIFMFLSVGLSV